MRYAAATFLGALLLFAVQPVLGKRLLPWFGGGPGVWTACLLCFQALLLAGYGWAHGLARLAPRRQALVHGAAVAVSLAWLAALALLWDSPITPGATWRPAAGAAAGAPVLRIVLLVVVGVGLPYALLASTSPVVQSWVARRRPGEAPYRLYALSNLGSLLGLVGTRSPSSRGCP